MIKGLLTLDQVYRATVEPIIPTIFQQTKATCFAYGQTGALRHWFSIWFLHFQYAPFVYILACYIVVLIEDHKFSSLEIRMHLKY